MLLRGLWRVALAFISNVIGWTADATYLGWGDTHSAAALFGQGSISEEDPCPSSLLFLYLLRDSVYRLLSFEVNIVEVSNGRFPRCGWEW